MGVRRAKRKTAVFNLFSHRQKQHFRSYKIGIGTIPELHCAKKVFYFVIRNTARPIPRNHGLGRGVPIVTLLRKVENLSCARHFRNYLCTLSYESDNNVHVLDIFIIREVSNVLLIVRF